MKLHPLYLPIKALLKTFANQDAKAAANYRRQLRDIKAMAREEQRLNRGTFLDERYALDYYFFTQQLEDFVSSYLKALHFVVSNALQPEPLRCDNYTLIIEKTQHALSFYLKDNHNFRYFKNEYGCTKM